MSAVQVLILVAALLVLAAVAVAVWIRKRRTGGILIADVTSPVGERTDPS